MILLDVIIDERLIFKKQTDLMCHNESRDS